jgi:NAD(P)-dependent dehydrogenase (short-subunit alcohol dehydrogenase family)
LEIRNTVALVTGGAHRIGKTIALALAEAGAHTLITYMNSADEAARTTREIEARGVQALAVQLDQRHTTQIDTLFATIQERFGRLDILVNSAAIMERKPILDITPDDWDRTLDTNLRGPFFVAQAAARLMLGAQPSTPASAGSTSAQDAQHTVEGCIVNIADLSALHPWPTYSAHTVSKAGLVALTKALALALAPSIRVNAVAPGMVLKPSDWGDDRWAQLAERIPLRRSGTPEDVAAAVLYLIRSDFVTGQVLVLDGGRELR